MIEQYTKEERRLIVRGMAYAETIAKRTKLINHDLMEGETASEAMKATIAAQIRAEASAILQTPRLTHETLVDVDKSTRATVLEVAGYKYDLT